MIVTQQINFTPTYRMKVIGASLSNWYKLLKRRDIDLKNFEMEKPISKLRLSSNVLAVVTGKWYSVRKKTDFVIFVI